MRGGAVLVLVGLTAVVAYYMGRQDTPASKPSPAAFVSHDPAFSKPVAFATSTETGSSVPAAAPPSVTRPATQMKPIDRTRTGEAALTGAAIAAIIIKASRDQYYATGHPCACPDDRARNGSSCGARSAYSRPGGAAPLCYLSDVTPAMIESYRRTASR
jgi:hypothetical protein